MSVLKVAAAQIACPAGLTEENLAQHLTVIDEARGRGIDVLVFPELSLTGYGGADLTAQARSAQAPELKRLADAAGAMTVAVGFIEEAPGAQFYNAQALLKGGEVTSVHRKLNLASYGRLAEHKHFGHGQKLAGTTIAGPWRAMILTCADLWNAALPWLAALQGATLLLVPAASSGNAVDDTFDNPGGWDIVLRHTALLYGLPVIFANYCGARGNAQFWGGSCVLAADGSELARARDGPAIVAADIDYDTVRAARARLPTIRDADPRFVHAALERLLQTQREY